MAAVLIGSQFSIPATGNIAFMLVAVVNPLSRRIERRKLAAMSAAA